MGSPFPAGTRPMPVPLKCLPAFHRTLYEIWVRRACKSIGYEFYRASLRERLPIIAIPLRETDADVPLDLQALVDESYENGDYDGDIDCQIDPDPPLTGDDARWADALLRKAGLRKKQVPRQRNGRK